MILRLRGGISTDADPEPEIVLHETEVPLVDGRAEVRRPVKLRLKLGPFTLSRDIELVEQIEVVEPEA